MLWVLKNTFEREMVWKSKSSPKSRKTYKTKINAVITIHPSYSSVQIKIHQKNMEHQHDLKE